MKILVLSDSHSSLRFMDKCTAAVRPDTIIHLGDYYDDGEVLRETHPGIPLIQVPGNCDRYRCAPGLPEILVETIEGVCIYLTHGHRHKVKLTCGLLLKDARAAGADIVLYGHTHSADCHQEEDGLWVMNPGTCGYYGGSAGVIEISEGAVRSCRIVKESDLENTDC